MTVTIGIWFLLSAAASGLIGRFCGWIDVGEDPAPKIRLINSRRA